MENPKIKTRVVHSQTKSAWNIVGETLGGKYKIARIPYLVFDNPKLSDINRLEAFKHAEFISHCFNHSDSICEVKVSSRFSGYCSKETLEGKRCKEICDYPACGW